MPTDVLQLDEPVVADAIRTVNFFNGRLLTGGDLGREQQARRGALARLGSALGDGVAHGLDISPASNVAPGNPPAITVQPGLAINRNGTALGLTSPATIALDRTAPPTENSIACLFDDCDTAGPGDYVGGQGLYLLVIAPAFVSEGRAQVSGMADADRRCAYDATVEAVRFRLIRIAPEDYGVPGSGANFRNAIAYRCFGDGVLRGWAADLISQLPRADDLIEELRGHGLEDEDVPLALIAFTGSAAPRFIDQWSVRRPLAPRYEDDVFANIVDPRRIAVGRAMFRQFQDEIAGIAATAGQLAATRARDRFAYLPPAGFLPILNDGQALAFFTGLTVRGPTFIDAACVEPLIRESLSMPAIPTAANEAGSDHAIWLYRVALQQSRPPNLIFASGHLPDRGDARFNLNHWDNANYALIP
ncbi:hypothetical protein [Sphingomonas sp. dw_22]|uniref:hypothetical protein n=1 Tax=Sphingomonas sp. dw_22 TaxID=2721175 RepID=UPI001BD4C657|nr:hypothetical protein [Sphingomonas sp. dw_22]